MVWTRTARRSRNRRAGQQPRHLPEAAHGFRRRTARPGLGRIRLSLPGSCAAPPSTPKPADSVGTAGDVRAWAGPTRKFRPMGYRLSFPRSCKNSCCPPAVLRLPPSPPDGGNIREGAQRPRRPRRSRGWRPDGPTSGKPSPPGRESPMAWAIWSAVPWRRRLEVGEDFGLQGDDARRRPSCPPRRRAGGRR